jgi:hypothetical protein
MVSPSPPPSSSLLPPSPSFSLLLPPPPSFSLLLPPSPSSGNTTTTLSYAKASKDPLAIAVADKLRKYLRLNDQYHQKEATTTGTTTTGTTTTGTTGTTGTTTNDHGMQALSILRAMDTSGDGVLSQSEFKRMLLHELGLPLSTEEFTRLMR